MPWKPLHDRTNQYNHCLGCPDRKVGCHATCEKYLADKAAAEEVKTIIREQKRIEDDYVNFLKDSSWRGVKRYGDGRKYR